MNYKVGLHGEDKACDFLKRQGLKLLTRNFKTCLGEIDLIMQDGAMIVFVEVRYRRSVNLYLKPVLTVTWPKQKRLLRTAFLYLRTVKKKKPFSARFDIIGIQGCGRIEWIKNAFANEAIS